MEPPRAKAPAKRPRVLLVSYTIPENKMGGGLLLYRHFSLQDNFELGIVTSNPSPPAFDGFYREVPEPRILSRAKRTRFSTWVHDYTHLVHPHLSDARLLEAATEFRPDVILNVAETYLSYHALNLAKKLKIPFASYFMDWANYAATCHAWAIPLMDRKFRQLYRQSDVAFCISEGMREELGPHPNARVVHPVPGMPPVSTHSCSLPKPSFTFCFAGNLAHWYGDQVASIMTLCENEPALSLRVFGAYHNWSPAFEERQKNLGVYFGFRPFEELASEFKSADAFLLPMGFAQSAALIERTSFKTKFLDYLLFEKPILVWGPEYCTSIKIARQYECALCITDPDPAAVIRGMQQIAQDSTLRKKLTSNALTMLTGDFHPDRITNELQTGLLSVLPSINISVE